MAKKAKNEYFFNVVEEGIMNPKFKGYRGGRIEICPENGPYAVDEIRFFIPNRFIEKFRELFDFKDLKKGEIFRIGKIDMDEYKKGHEKIIDLNEIAKELEKEKNAPCELTLKILPGGQKAKSMVYGSLEKRALEVIPLKTKDEKIKEDIEKLKGMYSSRKELKEKVNKLSNEYLMINKSKEQKIKGEKKLNYSYHVFDGGIYLHTADLHPGFMMGIGDKVARIKYERLKEK